MGIGSLGRRRDKPRSAAVAAAGCRALRQVRSSESRCHTVVEMRSVKLRLVSAGNVPGYQYKFNGNFESATERRTVTLGLSGPGPRRPPRRTAESGM
jgi:hypothetical protein